MIELKPCPFCGGKAVINTSAVPVPHAWVECTNCGVETSVYYDRDIYPGSFLRLPAIEQAKEAWNRRRW